MRELMITGILLFATLLGRTQNATETGFIGDARIDSLIQLHKLQNQSFPLIDGYRIQIYKETGNNALDSAWSVKNRFEARYSGVYAYISFREPYYRVRVGDFRTRLEAIRFLDNIHRRYPYAWEIKDKIRFETKKKKNPQIPQNDE